jgi:NTP pyrophosphatase (non-canonical NTP hydrolase)
MSLAVYQKQIDDWLKTYKKPYWSPLSQFARLTEEVGEVARILNHMYGDKVKKDSEAPDDLAQELADVLFAVLALANSEKIDLDKAFAAVMHKAQTRDKDRFEKKSNG